MTRYQKIIKKAEHILGLDRNENMHDWAKRAIERGRITKEEWDTANSKETQDFLREIGM